MSNNDEEIKEYLLYAIPKVKDVLEKNKQTNENFDEQYNEILRIEQSVLEENKINEEKAD